MNRSENKAEWNRLSILSLILSAGVIIPLLNNLIGVIAVATGIKALMEIRESKKEKGKYLAAAAVVIGCLPYWFIFAGLIEEFLVGSARASQDQFYLIISGTFIVLLIGAGLLMRKFKLL